MAGRDSGHTKVVRVQQQLVAAVRAPVALAGMAQAQREARRLLAAALKAAAIEPSGPRLTVWRPPKGGMIDYAPGVCVPHAFPCSGPVSLLTLPEGAAAHRVLRGPFDGMAGAWGQLFEDCTAERHDLAGLNWEVYPAEDMAPEAMETHLYALLR